MTTRSLSKIEKGQRYLKPEAVRQLEQMEFEARRLKFPNTPDYAAVKKSFRDDTAGGLTRCITTYLRLKGVFVSRLNNTGIYDPKLNRFRPGTNRKGLPDILATYKGRSLFIEVKTGRDRMRPDQERIRQEQTSSGGLYFIAKNFTEFKKWFDEL